MTALQLRSVAMRSARVIQNEGDGHAADLQANNMALTTASKAAGIDLLDRLYRNQILVHLLYEPAEREWLERIEKMVQAGIEEQGVGGWQAARLKHLALSVLEILVADEMHAVVARSPFEVPPLPSDLPLDSVLKVAAFNRKFLAALCVVASDSSGVVNSALAVRVAENLVAGVRHAPVSVRYRLAERVLAFEYPDAPIEALGWLAATGVVPPKKYDGRKVIKPFNEAVAIRVASICELEVLRMSALRFARMGTKTLSLAHGLRTALADRLPTEASARFLELAQAEERRMESPLLGGTCLPVPHPDKWTDKKVIAAFLRECHKLAPYLRSSLEKQSTALTDIAAAMIAVRRKSQDKAVFSETKGTGSIAHDMSAELARRGFTVDPRTLHRHFARLGTHLVLQQHYLDTLKWANVAFPAEWSDIPHLSEVARASVTDPYTLRVIRQQEEKVGPGRARPSAQLH
jgi:hypothetical protein